MGVRKFRTLTVQSLRTFFQKGIIDTRGSGGQVRLAAPPETNPDYNNYGTTEARRDQVSDRRNISRDEQLREPRREVSPSRRTSERMNDTEYRKTQFPGHRQDQRGGNRSSQKREEAAGEAQMKRRLDQMSDRLVSSRTSHEVLFNLPRFQTLMSRPMHNLQLYFCA